MKKILTIFTPTYNRAYCLGELYTSLSFQSNKSFKWLIIDDGSVDNTRELVDQWRAEGLLEISYYFKPNGGMHTAHNFAYDKIDTELNMCIDSDDTVPPDAVETIIDFWLKNKREEIGGIYALDIDKKGNVIGAPFPESLKSFKGWGCKFILDDNGKKIRVKGDKKFISVTSVLKDYPPIPVFNGEKYYSLYFKQHLIERDYRIVILNKPVCIVEYREDGSSRHMYRQYLLNPLGFLHLRRLMMDTAPIFEIRFVQAVHYVNASLIARNWNFLRGRKNWPLVLSAAPLGVVLHIVTLIKGRK